MHNKLVVAQFMNLHLGHPFEVKFGPGKGIGILISKMKMLLVRHA